MEPIEELVNKELLDIEPRSSTRKLRNEQGEMIVAFLHEFFNCCVEIVSDEMLEAGGARRVRYRYSFFLLFSQYKQTS